MKVAGVLSAMLLSVFLFASSAASSIGMNLVPAGGTAADNPAGVTIETYAAAPGDWVYIEIIRDLPPTRVYTGEDWTVFAGIVEDNGASDEEFLSGDTDLSDRNISTVLTLNGGYMPTGDHLVRVYNSVGEFIEMPCTITPGAGTGQTVTGTVYQNNLITPVTNALVYFASSSIGDEKVHSMAYTDDFGYYYLDIPSAAAGLPCVVGTFRDGFIEYAGSTMGPLTVSPGSSMTGVDVSLMVSDTTLYGTVTDYDLGMPVAGAMIDAGTADGKMAEDRSDLNGAYNMPVTSGDDWKVSGEGAPPGYICLRSTPLLEETSTVSTTLPGPNNANFVALSERSLVDALVLDEYGVLPVEGALVYASKTDEPFMGIGNGAYTDSAGMASVGVREGNWEVGVCLNCHSHPVMVDGTPRDMVPPPAQTIGALDGQTVPSEIWAYYADARLAGTVWDYDTGLPAGAGVRVEAKTLDPTGFALNGISQDPISGHIFTSTETDEAGSYSLPLLGGNWWVRANYEDECRQSQWMSVSVYTDGDDTIESPDNGFGQDEVLSWYDLLLDVDCSQCTPDTEPNDGYPFALPIDPGETLGGMLGNSDYMDYYSFTATAGDMIDISAQFDESGGNSLYMELRDQYGGYGWADTGNPRTISGVCAPYTGTYYIVLYWGGNAQFCYDLSLSLTPDTTLPTSEVTDIGGNGPYPTGPLVPYYGSCFPIFGTANDGDVGGWLKPMSTVQVSTDGGGTWNPATSDYIEDYYYWAPTYLSWHYDWCPTVDGSYTIISQAFDAAGNPEDITGKGVEVFVDVNPPTLEITDLQPNEYIYGTSHTITITADDGAGSGVDTVEVMIDYQDWRPATYVGGTTWSFDWTGLDQLPYPGWWDIYVRATDNAGHQAGYGYDIWVPVYVVGCTPDAEPNDDLPMALPLSPGIPAGGVLSDTDYVDVYKFNANVGDTYDINFQYDSLIDVGVDLYWGNSATTSNGVPINMTGTLPFSGEYYIVIYPLYGTPDPFCYTVSVDLTSNCTPGSYEPNDAIGNASPITVGSVLTSSLEYGIDSEDYYAFTASAGDRISVSLDWDTIASQYPNNLNMALLSPGGSIIVDDFDKDPMTLDCTALVDGTYYVYLWTWQGGFCYTMSLDVTACPGDAEPNDDLVSATPISVGVPVDGKAWNGATSGQFLFELSYYPDPVTLSVDLYSFTANAGEKVDISAEKFELGNAFWEVDLLDSSGAVLAGSGFAPYGPVNEGCTVRETGTYYVRVMGDYPFCYTFQVDTTPCPDDPAGNDTGPTATMMSGHSEPADILNGLFNTQGGRVDAAADPVDWYRFDAKYGDQIAISVDWESAPPAALGVYLLDEFENVIGQASGGDPMTVDSAAGYTGTYYIRLEGIADSFCYTLALDLTGCTPDAEPNDDPLSALPINPGETLGGTLDGAGGAGDWIDFYTFTATAGDMIDISAQFDESGGNFLYMEVYDQYGGYGRHSDTGNPRTISGVIAPYSGTYYIALYWGGNNPFCYDLSLDVTPDTAPPTSAIAGVPGSVSGQTFIISGSAYDGELSPGLPMPMSVVRVSTDGGQSWHDATSTYYDDVLYPAPTYITWAYVWTLPPDGSYTIISQAFDLAGNPEDIEGKGIAVTVANAPDLVSLYASPEDWVTVSDPVVWTATASSIDPVEYDFWLKDPTGNWTNVQPWSDVDTWSWTPGSRDDGAYKVYCGVRRPGHTSAEDSMVVGYDVVPQPTMKSLEVGPASPLLIGETATFTAQGTGGTWSYEYQFWLQHPDSTWSMEQDYSTDNTWTFTPLAGDEGAYKVQAYVRSAGSPVAYHDFKVTGVYDVIASRASADWLEAGPANQVAVGGTANFTLHASGGTESYEYLFWIKDPDGAWSMAQDWSTSPTMSHAAQPGEEGTYRVLAYVRNEGTSAADDYVSIPYAIVPAAGASADSIVFSPSSGATIGTPVTIELNASGGTESYEYRLWRKNPDGSWTLVMDYPTGSPTMVWPTESSASGAYKFVFYVRNAGATNDYDSVKASTWYYLTP